MKTRETFILTIPLIALFSLSRFDSDSQKVFSNKETGKVEYDAKRSLS